MTGTSHEIFLVVAPGLEPVLADEARAAGFAVQGTEPGGVTLHGGWSDIRRANRVLRGATRVLVRLGSFPVFHLAQLDKRAHKFAWADTLRPDVPVRLDVTCRRSKIYHAGAAAERIGRAITETLGAEVSADATLVLKIRIDRNLCTISVDTSGESLHRRGYKVATGKAPMRETLASLFLRACDYHGSEPVLDPMCGSGTFVIEAAEIAAGLQPGRDRHFAFENLAIVHAGETGLAADPLPSDTGLRFFGSDRDAGAIANSTSNAERAGVAGLTSFSQRSISDLERPEGPAGLVMINPPYGGRIGNKKLLYALYGTLGRVLKERFAGWRVGLVTNEGGLAKATALPLLPPGPPVDHGGLKIRLYQTKTLP